ncbi:NAD(P)-binding domain-containing protein [Clostridium sp. JNZ X4-2]
MNKTIGFIGCGNMGQAMIGGILNANLVESGSIIVAALEEKNFRNAVIAALRKTTQKSAELSK